MTEKQTRETEMKKLFCTCKGARVWHNPTMQDTYRCTGCAATRKAQ